MFPARIGPVPRLPVGWSATLPQRHKGVMDGMAVILAELKGQALKGPDEITPIDKAHRNSSPKKFRE